MNLKYLIKEAKYYKMLDGGLKRVFFKFVFSKTPLGGLVNSDLYQNVYGRMISKKSKKFRLSIISIENTSVCNARCVMCPHSKMKRKKITMSQRDFETVIDKIMEKEKIKYIMFTGLGEPLCDPEIKKKIDFINKKYGTRIILFTNAGMLTKKRAEELVKLKIFKINLSVNGPEEDYRKNMGLDYKMVKENINYFLKLKKEAGLKFPITNISMIILDSDKEKYERFKREWEDKVDSVIIFTPSNWSGTLNNNIVKKPFKSKRWACFGLWKNIEIDAEGNVVKCHGDYESRIKFGNLITEGYSQVDKKRGEIKKKQLEGDFSTPGCDACGNFESSLDWWE
jgi:radical SAM protein with 4Fe4S-binding SPASM domain